jgi:hypothetical protein
MATLLLFMEAAMNIAECEKMEGGEFFATVPGLPGLWAAGPTVEVARKELRHQNSDAENRQREAVSRRPAGGGSDG